MSKNKDVHSVAVRIAGDSGDGIQLMGSQFAVSTALAGADFATFPDYPAEIRAPVGTTFGVSAYQINLGGGPITTQPVPATDDSPQRRAFTRDDKSLGRAWVTPGMPGLMHRIGGLEKDIDSGHISYDPANHQRMTELRAAKIDAVAAFIDDQAVEHGPDSGDVDRRAAA